MCAPENSAIQRLSIIIIKNVHMEKLVHPTGVSYLCHYSLKEFIKNIRHAITVPLAYPTGVSYHCHYSPEAILITVTCSQRHLVLQDFILYSGGVNITLAVVFLFPHNRS